MSDGSEMPRPSVEIFTDGACSGNPGPGGWGAILRYNGHQKELKGGEPLTTNNRMELTAAIMALETLKRTAWPASGHTSTLVICRICSRWLLILARAVPRRKGEFATAAGLAVITTTRGEAFSDRGDRRPEPPPGWCGSRSSISSAETDRRSRLAPGVQ